MKKRFGGIGAAEGLDVVGRYIAHMGAGGTAGFKEGQGSTTRPRGMA